MKNIILICTVIVLVIGCDYKHTKPIPHIDYSKIEKVIVIANPKFIKFKNNDSVRTIPLSKAENVIVELNKSFNAGEIKFDYRTKLKVTFKDGTQRELEFTGDIVRENSEITQNLKIPTFSDDLWEMGEKK